MKKVPIDALVEVLSGFAFKSHHFNAEERGLPVIRIRDVKRGYSETYSEEKFDPKFKITAGDILIGMDGEFNCAKWEGKDALLNQRVCRIQAISRELDEQYLFWHLPKALKRIEDKSNFVTVKHLSVKQIKSIEIPLPPIGEQRRIAAILDKADAVRRKRKKAIALTEDLLRSAFLEMFGDPVMNPKGWDVMPLGKIAQIQGGLQVTTKRKDNPIEAPYLRVANVYRDRLFLDEIKTIRVQDSELQRTKLMAGDLLIVEGHGNREEIGRSSVWDDSIPNCTHQNHLIRVRVNAGTADPIYVSAYLNSAGGRRQLKKFGKTTSGLNTISASNVKATNVLLPPLLEQKKYLKIKQHIGKAIACEKNNQQYSEDLFNSLLQRAFRGDL